MTYYSFACYGRELWFNSVTHQQPWYIGKSVLDVLLCSFCQPNEILVFRSNKGKFKDIYISVL